MTQYGIHVVETFFTFAYYMYIVYITRSNVIYTLMRDGEIHKKKYSQVIINNTFTHIVVEILYEAIHYNKILFFLLPVTILFAAIAIIMHVLLHERRCIFGLCF